MDLTVYQERGYPGKKLIATGLVAWGVLWLLSLVGFRFDRLPEEGRWLVFAIMGIATVLYFVGYWIAVIAKGYSRVLFLAAFTGPIGAIILTFLPDIESSTATAKEPIQPPEPTSTAAPRRRSRLS